MKYDRILRLKRRLANLLQGSWAVAFFAFRIWGVPILGIVALTVLWRFAEDRSGTAILIMATSLICAIVTLLSVRSLGQRGGILGLAMAYLFIATGFGAAYHYVFVKDPYAFSFSSAIEEGKAINEFSEQIAELLELNDHILYLGIAQANLPSCIAAANNYTTNSRKRNWRPLDETTKVAFFMVVGPVGPSSVYMEIAEGSKKHTYGATGFGTAASHLPPLLGDENPSTFSRKLSALLQYHMQLRNEKLTEIRALVSEQPEWGLLDFVYFSVVTVTTLGYGDIIPNARLVRIVVLSQAILGVMYIAFALNFLWSKHSKITGDTK